MQLWMSEKMDSRGDCRTADGLPEIVTEIYRVFLKSIFWGNPLSSIYPRDQIRTLLLSKELRRFPAEN